MNDLLPAKIGKYPVTGALGHGATSRVYRADDPFSGKSVAIKVIVRDATADEEQRQQIQSAFLNEAALAGKLNHPHIAAIYDAVNDGDLSYLVMEYVEGGTLAQHCAFDALLSVERVVEFVFMAGLALAYAQQQGVIHCDIKPGNLLLAGESKIKVSDFGSAYYTAATHTYLTGIGSPAYMSPEQVNDRRLNHQTDIYSLGVVLYQLLTGRLPFQGSSRESLVYQIINIDPAPPSSHRPEVSPQLDRIVLRALAKDRDQRYAEWSDFSQDLARLFDHLTIPDQDPSDTERFIVLRQLPLFKSFGDIEIWESLRVGQWHRLPAGDVVLGEGDVADGFFILTAGELLVSREGYALDRLKPGQFFGDILYFEQSGTRRTTCISATTPVELLEIKASALARASAACQTQYNQTFLRILVKRIERIQERLAGVTRVEIP